jgi:hypothetical protein
MEGMADDDPPGVRDARLEPRGEKARRRRRDDDALGRDRSGGREQVALQLLALGNALLDEVGAAGGILRARRQREPALLGERRRDERRVCAAGVLEGGADVLLGARVGVEHAHVDPVEEKPGRPARTDHAGAEEPDRAWRGGLSHAA